MEALWNLVTDGIICISLKDRQDRRDKSDMEFNRVGISKNRFRYHLVPQRHPTNTNIGIFESHQNAIRQALREFPHARRILIFEDDIMFETNHQTLQQVLREIIDLVHDPTSGWQHIRLGGLPTFLYMDVPGFRHLYRITFMLCSHAYLIHRDFAEVILTKSYVPGLPYDNAINFWAPLQQFICEPMLVFQRDDVSDNINAILALFFTPLREAITHRRCMAINRLLLYRLRWVFITLVVLMVLAVMAWRTKGRGRPRLPTNQ